MIREMNVAGSFYPADANEINKLFQHFNNSCGEIKHNSRVVIVPHAGYIYSGYTANIAYRVLQNSSIKNFVVIGPSHRVAFNGVSISNTGLYETPLGDIKYAKEIHQKLKDKFLLECNLSAHCEHSTEVQFPFIKHYIKDANIVELVYGDVSAQYISQLIDTILQDKDCGVIISTDLSHFYNLGEANKLDDICLEAIKNLDIKMLDSGCEACGIIGMKAVMISAQKLNLKPYLLDYRTSADASGDSSRVVGYMSACFYE